MLRIQLLPDCLPMDQWREWKLADRVDIQQRHNSNLVEVSLLVMEALKVWEKRHSCHQKQKRGAVDGSDGNVWMEVKGLLGPC